MSQMSRLSPGPLPPSLSPSQVSDVSPASGPPPPSHSLPVSMSQMSRLSPGPPPPSHSLPVTMSQCLYASGGGLPGPAWQCLNASTSQRLTVSGGLPGPARSVSMSQCLNVSGGSAWAGTDLTMSHLSRLSRGVCLGQLGASAWANMAPLNVSMSQCLREVCPGQHGAPQCLNVSMSQGGLREVCLGQHGASQCLNVSVSQGGLPGPARRVSMSQCLSVSGRSAWASTARRRRASRASAGTQSIGKHQSGIRARVWEGNPKKKARPALPKPGTTPQPAKLPLEHTARAGRMQGSLVGCLAKPHPSSRSCLRFVTSVRDLPGSE